MAILNRRFVHRSFFVAALSSIVSLQLLGCEKVSFSSTTAPDPSEPGVNAFSYDEEPVKLFVAADMTVRMSGEVRGKLVFGAEGEAETEKHGSEHLLVTSRLRQLKAFQVEGEKLLDGKSPEQMKAEVAAGSREDQVVTDFFGLMDPKATEAFKKEKEEKKGQVSAQEVSRNINVASFLSVPELPRVPLRIGEKQKLKRQKSKEILMPGVEIPLDTDYKYMLEKVDESTGSRLATVKIESSTTGLLVDGPIFLQLFSESEGTLIYDLDRRVPVSYEGIDNRDFGFGDPAATTPQRMNQHVQVKLRYAVIPEPGNAQADASSPAAEMPKTMVNTATATPSTAAENGSNEGASSQQADESKSSAQGTDNKGVPQSSTTVTSAEASPESSSESSK